MKTHLSILLIAGLLAACSQSPDEAAPPALPAPEVTPAQPAPTAGDGGLTAAELAAEPPPAGSENAVPTTPPPDGAEIVLYNEGAYDTGDGGWMVDVIAGTTVYVTARLIDTAGEPIEGETLSVSTARETELMTAPRAETDEIGEATFGIRPSRTGADTVTVRWGEEASEIGLNVIAQEALDWQGFDEIDGVTPWKTLLGSRVQYRSDYTLNVTFSAEARALDGEAVRLAGFMLPLETAEKQRRFLLVSTPPSCFFHVPGGPAGAVEIRMTEGISMQWEPVMLAGTFTLIDDESEGIIYRLEDARQQAMPKR